MKYNYDRFKTSNYEYEAFPGPKAGEPMIDFTLHAMDGSEVKLSDFKGKWVVIETGSLTCPMFVKNINPIKKLRAKYPEVEFLVVYVREAHPGSRVNSHDTLERKIARGRETQQAYGDQRQMLVDSLEGAMHQAYGAFPNMAYVIDPDGLVVYRCDWAFAKLIEEVLDNRPELHPVERKAIITAAPWIMIPVTLKGGWDALWDLAVALPGILWGHLKLDLGQLFKKS